MRMRIVCALALLAAAGLSCSDDNPFAPIVGEVPSDVVGPSPLGAPMSIGIETVATGLVSPVLLVQAPGSGGLRYVVDQIGLIRVLDEDGALRAEPFLDVRARITPLSPAYDERGLLGLAFHPNFSSNRRFYVYYTIPPRAGAPAGYNHTNVISEYRAMAGDPTRADPASERVVMMVDHPQGNHNGGTIAFGPDGYLYISIGDGGAGNDLGLGHVTDWYAENGGGNGQDLTQNLLGSILRIDVDRGNPYAVPSDNPFVGREGMDEIWAYGFRNPYRFSFDMRSNRALLVGDAGQEKWEEVSVVTRGGNYGWNVREGTHCFDAEAPTAAVPSCPDTDPTNGAALRSPVIEFANSKQAGGLSLTVVGGNVYRGSDVPALRGMYVFGGATRAFNAPDGSLFVAEPRSSGLWPMQELLVNGQRLNHVVKGFGQDADGEVYVLASTVLGPTGTTGKVLRITAPTQ